MRRKALLANLGLMVAALTMCALLAEGALQVAMKLVRPRMTRLDPVVGWIHTPGASISAPDLDGHPIHVSYNSHGFRSPERAFARTPGRPRVLIVGGSFVDGAEVDDRAVFTTQLEQRLAGPEVVNLGVYGYNTVQELMTMRDPGLRFQPDAVVLLAIVDGFTSNVLGLESFGPAPRAVLDGDSLRIEGLDDPAAREALRVANLPAPGWVRRHSLVYHILDHSVYQRLAAGRIKAFQARRIAAFSDAQRVELFRRLVHRMQRLCEANGVAFAVALGYLKNDVRQHEQTRVGALIDSLAADGTTVLDLFAPLRAAELASDSSLYFAQDIHWNARGHRVVGGLLEPLVQQLVARPR